MNKSTHTFVSGLFVILILFYLVLAIDAFRLHAPIPGIATMIGFFVQIYATYLHFKYAKYQ